MEKSLGKQMRALSNLTLRHMEKLGYRGADSITGTNGWIIAFVAESDGDVFQRDLEAEFGITRSTASKVVNLMVQKGLVERGSVPYDARLKKLILTPRAMELYADMAAVARELEEKLTRGFTSQEKQQLMDYLTRMQNNLQ